jgi:phosphoribosylformylglycinamidine (FGAM) synthase-like amidotransferase family enzyme
MEISLAGHFYIILTEDQIKEHGGSYTDAVMANLGSISEVTDVQDDDDNINLAMRHGERTET